MAGRRAAGKGALPRCGGHAGRCQRRSGRGDRPGPPDDHRHQLSGPGARRPLPGQRPADRWHLPDRRLRVRGLGPGRLRRRLSAGAVPQLLVFRPPARRGRRPGRRAYRARLETAGIELGPDWESATTAVLAGAFLGRGQMLADALDRDDEWGTTTMRPRLLAWLHTFTGR